MVRQGSTVQGQLPIGDGGILEFSAGDLGGRILNDVDGSPGTAGYNVTDLAGFLFDVEPFGYEPGEAVGDVFVYTRGTTHTETVGYADNWHLPSWIPGPDGTPDDFDGDGTPDDPIVEEYDHAWDMLNYDYNGDGTIEGWSDSDADGTWTVPDAWQVDADADGTLDIVRFIWNDNPLPGQGARTFNDRVWSADSMRVAAFWEVPEPATIVAVGCGLAVLATGRRRKAAR